MTLLTINNNVFFYIGHLNGYSSTTNYRNLSGSPISIPVHHGSSIGNGLLKIHSPLNSPVLRKSPSPLHSPVQNSAFHSVSYSNSIDTSSNVRGKKILICNNLYILKGLFILNNFFFFFFFKFLHLIKGVTLGMHWQKLTIQKVVFYFIFTYNKSMNKAWKLL